MVNQDLGWVALSESWLILGFLRNCFHCVQCEQFACGWFVVHVVFWELYCRSRPLKLFFEISILSVSCEIKFLILPSVIVFCFWFSNISQLGLLQYWAFYPGTGGIGTSSVTLLDSRYDPGHHFMYCGGGVINFLRSFFFFFLLMYVPGGSWPLVWNGAGY